MQNGGTRKSMGPIHTIFDAIVSHTTNSLDDKNIFHFFFVQLSIRMFFFFENSVRNTIRENFAFFSFFLFFIPRLQFSVPVFLIDTTLLSSFDWMSSLASVSIVQYALVALCWFQRTHTIVVV